MPLRPPAGFVSANYDPLKTPDAPTIGTPTAGDSSVEVTFTPPANTGGSAITQYTAVSTPGGATGSGASSPVTVTGLSNGTSYTFSVWALNSYGPGPFSSASGSAIPVLQRGLFADSAMQVDYVTISTLGNSASFGDLLSGSTYNPAGCGSTTRGLIAGGGSGYTQINVIQYVTFATLGNATDFGDLTLGRDYLTGCSNATRGVFAGGADPDPGPPAAQNYQNIIDYVTIASTGNATGFGDLIVPRFMLAACASPTRGVIGGGNDGGGYNIIEYITIASASNSTDFGDLTRTNYGLAAFSSSTRGVFAGGTDGSTRKQIQYITIASTGNATNFGDLVQSQYNNGGVSSNTRGLSAGGATLSGNANAINYVTIATTGNAVYFGDLITNSANFACMSNCSGGVQ